MSHTNSTANYGLPQFLGSDKPAWLGDINPALSKVDQQMKVNADGVASATLSANNAQNSADNAKSIAEGAADSVDALGSTVSSQGNDINSLQSTVSALSQLFNLNDITNVGVNDLNLGNLVGKTVDLTLAQNSDGSIFKFYGIFYLENSTSATYTLQKTSVPGLTNIYGIPTSLFLKKAPTQAYAVSPYGIQEWATGTQSQTRGNLNSGSFYNTRFFVGTDGQIYLSVPNKDSETLYSQGGYTSGRQFYVPCIYINSDFGDIIID